MHATPSYHRWHKAGRVQQRMGVPGIAKTKDLKHFHQIIYISELMNLKSFPISGNSGTHWPEAVSNCIVRTPPCKCLAESCPPERGRVRNVVLNTLSSK